MTYPGLFLWGVGRGVGGFGSDFFGYLFIMTVFSAFLKLVLKR